MRIRKALVIKTEQEENGCVQIRHTYTIDDRLVTELVSLAISEAFLKASPSKDEAVPRVEIRVQRRKNLNKAHSCLHKAPRH